MTLTSTDEPQKVRRIKYALDRQATGGGTARQDIDNPFSPNFLMLDARNDGDKARWWAMYGKKKSRPDTALLERDV